MTATTLTAGTYVLTVPGSGPAADIVNHCHQHGIEFRVLEVQARGFLRPTQTRIEITVPLGMEITMALAPTRQTL